MAASSARNPFLVYLIVGVGGGILLAVLAWYNYNAWTALDAPNPDSPDCIRTRALVTERTAGMPGYRESRDRLTYRYTTAEGQTRETTEEVDPYYFQQAADNDSLTICYDRNQPSISAIPGNTYPTTNLVQILLLDILLIGCAIAAWIWFRKMKRQEKSKSVAGK